MDDTTPLLHALGGPGARPGPGPTTALAISPPPINLPQRVAIGTFSVVRILRGIFFLVYPAIGLSSFDIPGNGATYLLGSLIGSRDIILGCLLYTSYTSDQHSLRELRRALLANLLSDTADAVILIISAVMSWHWRHPVIEVLAVTLLAVLQHLTLWSLGDEEDLLAAVMHRSQSRSRSSSSRLRTDQEGVMLTLRLGMPLKGRDEAITSCSCKRSLLSIPRMRGRGGYELGCDVPARDRASWSVYENLSPVCDGHG